MQRVKAHELRQKDETSLVDELTKFRVRFPRVLMFARLERIGSIES